MHPQTPPQPNLRPYGLAGATALEAPQWPPEYRQQALARAAGKLAALRSGATGDKPAGAPWRQNITRLAFWWSIAFFFVMGGLTALCDCRPCIGFGLLLMLVPVALIQRGLPRSPERLLVDFYRCLGNGYFERALTHVIEGDKDAFPRILPSAEPTARTARSSVAFSGLGDFVRYWHEFQHRHSAPGCAARIRDVSIEMAGADVAVVSFQLHLGARSGFWFLQSPLGAVFKALASKAARHEWRGNMRKVVVRVGNGWKVFNGEWQGPEEQDLSWLTPNN